jgi:hypothetical protein
MKTTLFFLISAVCGFVLNFLASFLISYVAKRRSALLERVRMSSVEDARSVLRLKTRNISDDLRARLWSDTMNLLMTADSAEMAARYVEITAQALGRDGVEFRKCAVEVLKGRFNSDFSLHQSKRPALLSTDERVT